MPNGRPNVLFLMTDQQRYDCVGVNGNSIIKTPNLDALAGDGATFSHHFTSAAACVPSRACLMSGQHVHVHGVDKTSQNKWLDPSVPTLPGCFTAAGYNTVGVGKMHFTPWNLLGGFERRVPVDGISEHEEYGRMLKEKGLWGKQIGHHTPGFGKAFKSMPTTELTAEDHVDGFIGRRGLESLEELLGRDEPFFLAVSFVGPHEPLDPPHPYDKMYDHAQMPTGHSREGELDVLPKQALRRVIDMGIEHLDLTSVPEDKKREMAAYYYGKCTMIDDWVGRLIESLKASGKYDDTIILFTTDHGEYLADHNIYYKAYFPCDSDCRIPLIIKAPQVAPGTVADCLSGNVDIMPTLLELAGIPVPDTCQGANCLAADAADGDARDCVVTYSEAGPAYRLRTRDWAYVYREGGEHDQLYNFAEDPHELNSVAHDPAYEGQKETLRRRLLDWFIETSRSQSPQKTIG